MILTNFANLKGIITNEVGLALLRIKSEGGLTVTYKVYDTSNTLVYNDTMSEIGSNTGLYYTFLSMLENDADLYRVEYYVESVLVEQNQILNKLVAVPQDSIQEITVSMTEDLYFCNMCEEDYCTQMTENAYYCTMED